MASTPIVRSGSTASDCGEKNRPRRDEVRTQLDRILASPLFHHSKHYPSFLRHVVNEALEGRVGQLKERLLGVEVFGRDPDYDTTADPVVRTSACEVRKRIARYYQEPGHEYEIRIDLPPGSYIPEFRYAAAESGVPVLAEAPPAVAPVEVARQAARHKWPVVAIGVCALAFLGIAAELRGTGDAVESFWNPVWGSADIVMMAMGSAGEELVSPPAAAGGIGPSFRDVMRADRLAFSDALTMARITGLTREYGKKKLDIRHAASFTLSDLRTEPVILVGAFNNPWTMRLNTGLRFVYEWSDQTHTGMIRDRQHPSNWSWIHDPGIPYSKLTQDYAVVSRFLDPLTEKMVVVVGGMGRDGTIAAGEFVTNPHYLKMLASRAPRHWERMNLQVVVATDIVGGKTGPPRILTTYFW